MATAKQITAQYIEFIAREVIERFGGSYTTYETIGKTWRKQMPYSPKIEQFILERTKLFMNMLNLRDRGDINLMYKVSYGISEHTSKYLVRRSQNLTRADAATDFMKKIFLESTVFVRKFQSSYKQPIDTSDTKFATANPGVVAMYSAIQSRQH
ncbi:MAG: hypothetical protein IJ560_04565 [Alphaproteobacteria bacterium]|nr:hypothetical protein [Alphaproteobacteria bacterium]